MTRPKSPSTRRRRRTVRDKLGDLILGLEPGLAVGRISTYEGGERFYAARVGGPRWFVTVVRDGQEFTVHGWETMTHCVKSGITIDWDDSVGPCITAKDDYQGYTVPEVRP